MSADLLPSMIDIFFFKSKKSLENVGEVDCPNCKSVLRGFVCRPQTHTVVQNVRMCVVTIVVIRLIANRGLRCRSA